MKNNGLLAFAMLLVCSFYLWKSSNYTPAALKLKDPAPRPDGWKAVKKFHVLAWNEYWRWPDYGMVDGFKHCIQSNCYLTLDKNRFNDVDAILMHGPALSGTSGLRKAVRRDSRGWPLFLYFNKESPM